MLSGEKKMSWGLAAMVLCFVMMCSTVMSDTGAWWNQRWRMRTTVTRPTPWRSDVPRPVEVAVDFPGLMRDARVRGQFDPGSIRVVETAADGKSRVVSHALRTEYDARLRREQSYLAWIAEPTAGRVGRYDIYFDTTDRGIDPAPRGELPPENLLTNPSFEQQKDGEPTGWTWNHKGRLSLARFEHTTGRRSVLIEMDADTPEEQRGEVVIAQMVDVSQYAGQEVVAECDLLCERGFHGAPMSIETQQFRADGSRIVDYAVPPKWLTVELAEGQLVQFSERGFINPEAARVNFVVRLRPYVGRADDGRAPTAEEQSYRVWLDRCVLRPGERWPWPGANEQRFVAGALEQAPPNRAVDFVGQRRLFFCPASEGTLQGGTFNPNPRSAHWGLREGTIEMWVQPHWSSADGERHQLLYGVSYGHAMHSRLQKRGGNYNDLEFTISDADQQYHTINGPLSWEPESWHHVAVTWDFEHAQLQMFADGQLVAADGPADKPWAWTLDPRDPGREPGRGVSLEDRRSLPMQVTLGGDSSFRDPANVVMDEVRISDVVRYRTGFDPPRAQLPADDDTRALFHFEDGANGVHAGDDRYVEAYFCHELPPQGPAAPLELLGEDGAVTHQELVVLRPANDAEFQRNQSGAHLAAARPFVELPDPRFIECRQRSVEATVSGEGEPHSVQVGGDYLPLMLWE
ncbi:MAG TPA: LamG domain-containing protein, partial [Armatimonadota bacterium]|nr:LamG domain-containing protein [Armatimonadota bacterium]